MSRFDTEFRDRFAKRVQRTRSCWWWLGAKTATGYGQIQARKVYPQPMLAHRVAWEIRHGTIPEGIHVLHRCDNPRCVRVSHLFLGTQRDNNADRHQKGRTASGDRNGARTCPQRNPFVRNGGSGLRGERHPMAKLSDAQVAQLRREFATGEKRTLLATRYKISLTHVYRLGKSE